MEGGIRYYVARSYHGGVLSPVKKREILWNDDISDATIDIALYIKKWNTEDKDIAPAERQPIKIFINSGWW